MRATFFALLAVLLSSLSSIVAFANECTSVDQFLDSESSVHTSQGITGNLDTVRKLCNDSLRISFWALYPLRTTPPEVLENLGAVEALSLDGSFFASKVVSAGFRGCTSDYGLAYSKQADVEAYLSLVESEIRAAANVFLKGNGLGLIEPAKSRIVKAVNLLSMTSLVRNENGVCDLAHRNQMDIENICFLISYVRDEKVERIIESTLYKECVNNFGKN